MGVSEVVLGVVSLGIGVAALLLAETVAAETLLAFFIGTIVVTWGVQLLHHSGVTHTRPVAFR